MAGPRNKKSNPRNQESELSTTMMNTSALEMEGDSNVFKGKFTIDIGNPYVDGSFYPGNPRVTGINIYRSIDDDGEPQPYKKIITASALGRTQDLNIRSCTTGVSKNFLYDQADFTQIGVTTDHYVYQAGQGNISEVEPDNSLGHKQEGLLKLSASTLGMGKGCHPHMIDFHDATPVHNSADYVIVNRDLRTQLGGNGTYWCAEQDDTHDPSGVTTWFRGTTFADYRNFATTGAAKYASTNSSNGYGNNSSNQGWFGRNLHSSINTKQNTSARRFANASFNGNSAGTLTVGTEYYWEAYVSLPEASNLYTILAVYTDSSIPTTSGFSWHADSQLLAEIKSGHYGGHGQRPVKLSGYYTPTNANFHLMFFTSDQDYEYNTDTAISWIDTERADGVPSSGLTNGAWVEDAEASGEAKIYEFLIFKSSDVIKKGTTGCIVGYYSQEFNTVGDDTLRGQVWASSEESRGYPTTGDAVADGDYGWIAGSYGNCVLPWSMKERANIYPDTFNWEPVNDCVYNCSAATGNRHYTWIYRNKRNIFISMTYFNNHIPEVEGDGILTISPNYLWRYNQEESGGLDTTTNNIKIDFEFYDDGITDGAEHPGTVTLSTDVRYKYQTNHIGRRFVGNCIINAETDAPETHPDFIFFSELGNPDVIPIGNFIKLNDLDGGEITGLAKSLGDIVALMERGVFILSVPSTDITQWTLTETYKDTGCTSPNSVCEYNNGVFFGNEDNFYYLDSGRRLITLTDSWSDDYQKYFREGVEAGQDGIKQVMVIPNKNELVLIMGKKDGVYNPDLQVYILELSGFEEQSRWSKGLQTSPSAYVVDNLKQVYSFQDWSNKFKRYLVLSALDTEKADGYDNVKSYDLYLETPFQKLTDLDSNVIIRKLNLRYNSVEPIYIDIYTDGDATNIKKTIEVPITAVDINLPGTWFDTNTYDDSEDFTHEANIKLRANRVKFVIRTGNTGHTQTSIRRLEIEID